MKTETETKNRIKRRPRSVYWSSVVSGVTMLLVLGGVTHYAAQRNQRRYLEGRLEALERKIESLQKVKPSASSTGETSGKEPAQEAVRPSPRVLGSGRTGPWRYSDIRFDDGEIRRYYIRTNATPAQVVSYIRGIQSDAEEHLKISLDMSSPL